MIITGQRQTLLLEASRISFAPALLLCFAEDFFCLPGQYGVSYLQLLSFGSTTDIPEILLVTSFNGYLTSQLCENETRRGVHSRL